MKLQNPKSYAVIESPFTSNTEAAEALSAKIRHGMLERSEFTDSLLGHIKKGYTLSQAQAFWLHKMAMPEAPPPAPSGRFDLSGLRAIFSKAAEKLKFPAIVLQLPDGREMRIYTAGGPNSKHVGCLMVVSKNYDDQVFYGRVTPTGDFYAGKDDCQEARTLLQAMSEDPAGTARAYGTLTGCCCFCCSTLTDERSIGVGYGPVCAKNFGLPWGGKAS